MNDLSSTTEDPPPSPAPAQKREAFIPVALDELERDLIADEAWSATEREEFAHFARLYGALDRARLEERLRALRRAYRPFDPDCETVTREEPSQDDLTERRHALRAELEALLEKANYRPLGRAELEAALTKVSPGGLVVSVDLEDFDELGLYYRGAESRTEEQRDWRSLYLRKRPVEVPVFRRLFLLVKLREGADADARHMHLKLFREVPETDLEMLLPNTRVRMRVFDKVKIGVTGGGGTVGGVLATAGKVGVAANPTTWILAIAGLAGVIWRQVSKVFQQRTRYMATLARCLYFQNLDNNSGALVHLVELAHAEESKEALLAYALLLQNRAPLTAAHLDRAVERYLARHYGVDVDYEVPDGIRKLHAAELLTPRQDALLSPVPLPTAVATLTSHWQAFPTPPPPR